MRITITGTPGTGKSTVAEGLGKRLGTDVIGMTSFFETHDIGEVSSGEREVDINMLSQEAFNLDLKDQWILEGHLSHHVSSDICIVLRCHPETLEKRLSDRGYSDQKLRENLESEALDLILQEAIQRQDTVIEVDTTGTTVENTVSEIIEKVEDGESDYGSIDFSDAL